MDNGIGFSKSQSFKKMGSQHKSVGLTLTNQRLNALHRDVEKGKIRIEDANCAEVNWPGTKVTLTIPINKQVIMV